MVLKFVSYAQSKTYMYINKAFKDILNLVNYTP
jgi:hypothetical protein